MAQVLQVGEIQVHLISSGYYMSDAGVLHGIVPKALWSKYEDPDSLNRVRFEMRTLFIETGGLRILVDNGYGTKLAEKQQRNVGLSLEHNLADDLHALGLEHADIDLMVDTHLHADHAGGNTILTGGKPIPAFPNARYVIQRGEYDAACRANERTRATYLPENFQPVVDNGQADLVTGDYVIAPGVTMERAPGHTADHCIIRIASKGQTALFLADLVQRPVQLEKLAWVAAYDIDPMTSIESKRRVFTEAAEQGHTVILQHHAGVGTVTAKEGGFEFHPIDLSSAATTPSAANESGRDR